MEKDLIFLDIETQLLSSDVGGWGNIPSMKIAIVCVYSSKDDKFNTYTEGSVSFLIEKLKKQILS